MKSLFLAFALIFGLSSFSIATDMETVDNSFVNESVFTQIVEEDLLGICHIRIYDNETGNLVYEAFLPANTAADCRRMLEATLAAMQ